MRKHGGGGNIFFKFDLPEIWFVTSAVEAEEFTRIKQWNSWLINIPVIEEMRWQPESKYCNDVSAKINLCLFSKFDEELKTEEEENVWNTF